MESQTSGETVTSTLFLQFQIGTDSYAIEAAQVARILPLVDIKRIPGAPAGVAGAFNYRGMPVPVVDLSEIAAGLPAPRRLSTRVILVNFRDGADNERLLGLLAERVTETFQRDTAEFVASGVTSDAAPYLGPVAAVGGRLLQLVQVRNLLPARITDALFRELEVGT